MDVVGVATADRIADALRGLSVRSSIFCLSELGAPWGFRVDDAGISKFHLVLAGSGWLTLDGHEPVHLRAGDLALLPRGHAHAIRDAPGSPVTELDQMLAHQPLDGGSRLRWGGSGALTRLLCGEFVLGCPGDPATLALVPDLLRVDAQSVAATTWLAPILATLETELAAGNPGSSAIQAKIADVFVTQALRSWLVAADRAGVLSPALLSDDEPIAMAIAMVRNDLAAKWTIDKLASSVGLSRTSFASRFRRVVGDSPMSYVTRLRISTAAGLLTTTRLSVHEVARSTGYDTDAALSKAFKRELGQPPGAYRARRMAAARG